MRGLSGLAIADLKDPEIVCLSNRNRGKPLSGASISVIIRKYLPDAGYHKRELSNQEIIRNEHRKYVQQGKTCVHKKRCGFCDSLNRLEEHHMIPVALGGTNDQNNLIYLCHDCHKKVTQYQRNLLTEEQTDAE